MSAQPVDVSAPENDLSSRSTVGKVLGNADCAIGMPDSQRASLPGHGDLEAGLETREGDTDAGSIPADWDPCDHFGAPFCCCEPCLRRQDRKRAALARCKGAQS